MTTHADAFDLAAAPLRIGRVRLRVRDLDSVAAFYRRVLGLDVLASGPDRVTLGTGTTPLLDLAGDARLRPRDPRDAGLFHTAFLLPGRSDLGRWLRFAIDSRIPLHGASDHIVSEAIYLADPEGNGIEIYADRPPSAWRGSDGEIHMTTEALDSQGLLASADGAWTGFPQGGTVGHVHLQVGDTAAADRFYRDVLGFDIASRYPGASFFGSGGYHHQLACNVWNSRRAGPRPDDAAGLDAVEIVLNDATLRDPILRRAEAAGVALSTAGDVPVLRDPWGTRIALAA